MGDSPSRGATISWARSSETTVRSAPIALGLLLALIRVGAAAELPPSDVFAHGDSDRFWIALVRPVPGPSRSVETLVYFRPFGQDHKWQKLAQVPARVIALSSQGSQAGIVLGDGSWLLLYSDGTSVTAGALPNPARMVALSGGRDTWWSLGVVPGGIWAIPPRPTTEPAMTAATQPRGQSASIPAAGPAATRSAANRLVLFRLTGNDWTAVSELPGDVPAAPSVSLALVGDMPYVGMLDGREGLHVRRFADGQWVEDRLPAPAAPIAALKLLPDPAAPRLWLAHEAGPDALYALGSATNERMVLQPIPGSRPEGRTLATATGTLRMIALVQGKLVEQDFSAATGAPEGAPRPLGLPQEPPLFDLQTVQYVVVSVALLIAILGSFRQRSALRGAALQFSEIPLAPYGRRLLGGIIDAAPVLLALLIGGARLGKKPMSDQDSAVLLLLIYWAAGLFYVLYTTLIESLTGRTLGKRLTGLTVIALDGKPPTRTALLTRNILRLIEVGLFFVPLLMVVLFPLRQRAGDVAAGTLVVFGNLEPREQPKQEEPAESMDGRN